MKQRKTGSQFVDEFFTELEHPQKEVLLELRKLILKADREITEHIKWKGPSFCFDGEDRVTTNIHRDGSVMMVFHRGAKVKDPDGFAFDDKGGLMEWKAADRSVIMLADADDLGAKKEAISDTVARWVRTK